jgi:GNAT superfamily N-acetyltransferase
VARNLTARGLGLPIATERFRLEHGAAGSVAVFRTSDEQCVGEARVKRRGATLVIESVCIDASERGFGAGSESVVLLAQAARAAGCSAMESWAPASLGLAVYFWMRMGFRPRFGRAAAGDGVEFEREL